MESLLAALTSLGVVVVAMLVRIALFSLVLMLVAGPVLALAMLARGAELLWQRAVGRVPVDGLLWRSSLYYTPAHTWLAWQGSALRIGFDDLAQRVLFGAQAIDLPRLGQQVREGQTATVVRYGNKRAEIASPVDGVVAAVNEAVHQDLAMIHRDPYDRGWLYAVMPSNFPNTSFLRGRPARNWFRNEGGRLAQFLEHTLGVAAADGGELLLPAASLLSEEQWDALTKSFLRPERIDNAVAPVGSDPPAADAAAQSRRHTRAFTVLMAIVGPIAGGLYVVLLPVIGVAMLLGLSSLWAWRGIRRGVSRAAALFAGKESGGSLRI